MEFLRRSQNSRRREWIEFFDELCDRHTRDEVRALDDLCVAIAGDDHAAYAISIPVDSSHLSIQLHHPTLLLDLVLDGVPHHPWTEPWVLELLNEGLDGLLRFEEHIEQGRPQREILDALGGPFG